MRFLCTLAILLLLTTATRAEDAAVLVRFEDDRDGAEQTVEGRILVEAADGGVLVEDRAGTLWSITPDRLSELAAVDRAFTLMDADELAAALEQELGDGFAIEQTPHYVLCSSAGPEFTGWIARLFERLLRAFLQHWERAGLELHEPAAPLAAVVFADRIAYAEYATRDAGPQLAAGAGYYSVRTNRIVLYDLATGDAGSSRSDAEISRRVAAAPANIATIVHEAAHQIAFNSGMQTRYADNPMWLTEGLAMYCETPDLDTGSGWQGIGKLNPARLRDFRRLTGQERGGSSLESLISDDARFRDPSAAAAAYAESWALTYFLIRTRREAYIDYVGSLADKPRLIWDTPAERLDDFQAAFGDLSQLEGDFRKYMARLGNR